MPDSKITALTSISTSTDPANDPLVIVDVSDTSMAATGTTKKVTLNQLLATSPTATLASATISGDLTVRTDKLAVRSTGVGIGTTTPNASYILDLTTAYDARARQWIADSSFIGSGNLANGFTIRTLSGTTDGIRFLNYAQTTEFMRIDATGLGVGGSPTSKLSIFAGADGDVGFFRGGSTRQLQIGTSATAGYLNADNGSAGFELRVNGTARAYFDTTGNVGIGVTPSAWDTNYKALQLGYPNFISGNNGGNIIDIGVNAYFNTDWKYAASSVAATRYRQVVGVHQWFTAPSGTAGNAITFTQAMTLDASGRLFVGATSITAGYSGNNYLIVGGVASPTIKLQSTTGPAAWDIYSAGGLDLFIAYNSSDKGQFSISTGAYTALSDANKKRDFEPSNIGLAEVLKLQPKLFRMIDDSDDAPKQLGFVAQDVQSVIPQAYSENDGQGGKFIGLQDRPIIAALTRAIQELAARVQTLETR